MPARCAVYPGRHGHDLSGNDGAHHGSELRDWARSSPASTGAYQPCPNMAVYGATKAFVLSFTEALAYETRESGLSVLTVSPGATRTEFFDVVGTRDAAVGRFQTTEQVVTRALRELDRASTPPSFVSGRLNATMAKLAAIIPRRLALIGERAGCCGSAGGYGRSITFVARRSSIAAYASAASVSGSTRSNTSPGRIAPERTSGSSSSM